MVANRKSRYGNGLLLLILMGIEKQRPPRGLGCSCNSIYCVSKTIGRCIPFGYKASALSQASEISHWLRWQSLFFEGGKNFSDYYLMELGEY